MAKGTNRALSGKIRRAGGNTADVQSAKGGLSRLRGKKLSRGERVRRAAANLGRRKARR